MVRADKESKEGALPAHASVGAGGHMPGAPLPGLPLQGQEGESGTHRLAAATALVFRQAAVAQLLAPVAAAIEIKMQLLLYRCHPRG
jgi:hypothetical protein